MNWSVLFEILAALFAVIGLYGSFRWGLQKLFGSRKIFLAVEILTQRDAESAEFLIRDALFQYLNSALKKVVIFTTPELIDNPKLLQVAEQYGISCVVVTPHLGKDS